MVHSLVVCLTTGPKTLPKRALHIVRSRASSFKSEYPLLSLRSSNSFLRLLPCLPVTSIPPCIFLSVTRCRMQFLRKMWPIQLAFLLDISCRIILCPLTVSNTYFFIIPFYIILPSPPRFSKWSAAFGFTHQTPVCISALHSYVPYVQPITFCFIDQKDRSWRSSSSLLFPPLS